MPRGRLARYVYVHASLYGTIFLVSNPGFEIGSALLLWIYVSGGFAVDAWPQKQMLKLLMSQVLDSVAVRNLRQLFEIARTKTHPQRN